MLMAGDSSNWSEFPAGGEFAAEDFGGDEMCMDVDALFQLLEEDPTSGPEDYELQAEAGSGAGYHEDTQLQSGSQVLKGEPSVGADLMGPSSGHPPDNVGLCNPPYISEASDSAAGGTGGSYDSAGNHGLVINYKDTGLRAQTGSPGHACSTSLKDWISLVPCKETCFTDRAGLGVENIDTSSRTFGPFGENTTETMGPSENNSCTSVEPFMDICSPNVASTDSDIFTGHYPATDDRSLNNSHLENSSMQPSPYHYFPSQYPRNEEMMTNVKDESVEFQTDSSCSSSKMNVNYQDGTGNYVFDSPVMIDGVDMEEWNFNNCISAVSGNSSFNVDFCPADNKASVKPLSSTETYISGKREVIGVKDEKIDEFDGRSSDMYHSFPFVDETVSRNSSYSADGGFFDKESKPSSFDLSSQTLGCSGHAEEDMFVGTERACYSKDNTNGSSFSMDGGTRSVDLSGSEHQLPAAQPFYSNKNLGYMNGGHEAKIMQPKSTAFPHSKFSPETTHSNFSYKSSVQDDPDICILENLSDPAPSSRLPVVSHTRYPAPLHHSPALGSTLVNQQQSSDEDTGVGGMRFKTRDEQLILRVALQDLSQPKSEAIPPDGLLSVPLLRHQRIALSWMVQKETASLHCSGGILADDQGLGKTISTIALILKERAPPFGACEGDKKCKLEALDLDKDEDMLSEDSRRKKDAPNATSDKSMESLTQTKGRPAAGTLVVCPTSVLRQWAEELRNKVTEKANLSVLVYHGGNRTKDPCELAKYDVVLTTYSIVSMEVPKQPLADEEDGEKRKKEEYDTPLMGFPSSKKRKYPPSSGNKPSKGKKKGLESVALESVARPLAKVGWFRVVLDEAQSIKNHRTQVARACWGLRAKRRWCLSGTPIQNAIDDLYSYFRFLRYDPYAVYKSFCATIKFPISRNPTKGYRKLQAVLKTIMLRRTKGTLLDGEPIVKLPPKSVELKRVEFSDEERDFYSRLEFDSRAQFQEYAAAGTVKQNYVNILLMLLRLRQACDHPLLVRRYESQSLWKSSVEKAKKLPHDKQVSLLNCLEASLAICGICNDAPEDAVVSECGHVFCSQCICDSLTGDDNQCPNTNCKVRLNVSSVFSKATLTSSLSDQPNEGGMGSEVFDAVESFYEDSSYNSSKIKAALQVLCSMCKPKDCTTGNSCLEEIVDKNASSSAESPDNDGVESLEDLSDTQNLVPDRSSKNPEKVVGEKAIVFSQWTRMLDLLEASLKTSGLEYRRLDGTMSVMARDKAVKDFNTIPEVTVMIMSLKAASLGLNMVAACRVLLLDLWWNPTTEDQAIDRAHRIGQTRPVTVLRLTVKDTVEDRILALQKKKREMVASAFGEDEAGGRQTRLTVDDLKYLFMM